MELSVSVNIVRVYLHHYRVRRLVIIIIADLDTHSISSGQRTLHVWWRMRSTPEACVWAARSARRRQTGAESEVVAYHTKCIA